MLLHPFPLGDVGVDANDPSRPTRLVPLHNFADGTDPVPVTGSRLTAIFDGMRPTFVRAAIEGRHQLLSIFGVQELASGRAAILGFTMPIFTVLLGAAFFGERITPRIRVAVLCAALAIGLLLWHELARLSGRPQGIAWMIGAALSWALGTLMFRRARLTLSPLVVTVWMLLLGSVVVGALAITLEPLPDPSRFSLPMWTSLAYGVVINYGFAQLIWFGMARDLPPATSAMSIMAIPLVGTLSAALIIGEIPHWQDWLAMGFVMMAIASVLWPARRPMPTTGAAQSPHV